MIKKKIIIEINKQGEVQIIAEGYIGDSCQKSEILNKILKQISSEGEIDVMEKLFEETHVMEERKEISVEELI